MKKYKIGNKLITADSISKAIEVYKVLTKDAVDIDKYQMWVDYDMKHYHHISEETNEALKRADLEVVKDDHGDYEVIAKETNGHEDSCSVKKNI